MKGGGTQRFEVVLTRELEVLDILMGGAKLFHHLKGCEKSCSVLRGKGAQTFLEPQFSNFVDTPPPPPVINDRSLKSAP